eukprot:2795795-Rhodomonas_salina.3
MRAVPLCMATLVLSVILSIGFPRCTCITSTSTISINTSMTSANLSTASSAHQHPDVHTRSPQTLGGRPSLEAGVRRQLVEQDARLGCVRLLPTRVPIQAHARVKSVPHRALPTRSHNALRFPASLRQLDEVVCES